MADNFQLPSLSLELYGDILETPYPFLFSAKELGETSQARGRALEGGEAVRRGGGEGRAGACRPGLKMERERDKHFLWAVAPSTDLKCLAWLLLALSRRTRTGPGQGRVLQLDPQPQKTVLTLSVHAAGAGKSLEPLLREEPHPSILLIGAVFSTH